MNLWSTFIWLKQNVMNRCIYRVRQWTEYKLDKSTGILDKENY